MKVFNTLTRKKEELIPRDPGKISMYVCGPTAYNYIHIGNARTFLNFDVIRRYLEFAGFELTYVRNITDIDDKIINRAHEEGTSPSAISEKYTRAFEEDMQALGVKKPDIEPRATEHVPDMIEVISVLEKKGYAYAAEGNVYFEVSKFPGYGKLAGRSIEEADVSSQSKEEIALKKNPFDFALWKASKPGEPAWDSPWGPGRPGWHIECSTMSVKYLGNEFDIHGGGSDLIFPHHENEIAQAEAYSGKRFARYWIHSGMLNIKQEKMSKSIGNIVLLRDVLSEWSADCVRILVLGTHYRSPLSFGEEALEEANTALERISTCLFGLRERIAKFEGEKAGMERTGRETMLVHFLNSSEQEFRENMEDDFNTAAALGVIFKLVRELNHYMEEVDIIKTPAAKLVLLEGESILTALCETLGLLQGPQKPSEKGFGAAIATEESPTREQLIEMILEIREEARRQKNFSFADGIRKRLSELGVTVEDGRDGFRWRIKH